MRFLALTLAAPLASFGSIAVGERRPSWDRPGKSAVLGLVAGALGLTRDEAEAHRALDRDYRYAVRVEDLELARRRPLLDYHTVQTAPSKRRRRFATRREELSSDRIETILTRREYRSDCCFTILLWTEQETPRFSLLAVEAALNAPAFTPYFGRKSCPLALPMAPRIVEAEEPLEAFGLYDGAESKAAAALRKRIGLTSKPRRVALDAGPMTSSNHGLLEKRRDAIIHRDRWRFGLREEVVVAWSGDGDE